MAEMTAPVDQDDLIYRHLDRMSMFLINQGLNFRQPKAGIYFLFTYHLGVQHLENILTDVLQDEYIAKKKEIFDKMDVSSYKNLSDALFYFTQLSLWLKLLYVHGVNAKLLKRKGKTERKKPWFYDEI